MFKENKKLLENNALWIALLGCLIVALFHRILFTDQIIRASDILTQMFWSVKGMKGGSFLGYLWSLPDNFHANWEPFDNGGRAGEGGGNALSLLFYRTFVYQYFPFPSSIAWLAVLSLIWGGIGTYYYCRSIGLSRFSSFAAGFLFAYCAENVTLINAGHMQKIETISWFPWAILYLEKALQSRRFYHYALCALFLAIQFFSMHWQISFYSCLGVAIYWLFMTGATFMKEKREYARTFGKDLALGLVIPLLFLTTIAMSFLPTLNMAKQSERSGAITSGASGGDTSGSAKKGIGYEEGMSWSMPPEEILTYVVPGLVGFSRQEAGDIPAPGQVFYWGRMHITQTTDYLGLLPWLLLPLCFLFKRDRYTWFFTSLMALTLVMALGKYTFVYRFMFDHLPGFATFRVPKMILFVFAFAVAVLMGRGLDQLVEQCEERKKFKYWLIGLGGFTGVLALFALFLGFGSGIVIPMAEGIINVPTRYQIEVSLIDERYVNMIRESLFALGIACVYMALLLAWFWKKMPAKLLFAALFVVLLLDLWRVNDQFLVLCPPPSTDKKKSKTDVVAFLEKNIGTYRMQPIGGRESFYYADYKLPNISAYVTISERRYKEYLDNFSLLGVLPDIFNLKYLVMPTAEYEAQKGALSGKYTLVFISASAGEVVLENKTVMPKAWLVPSVAVVTDPQQRLVILSTDPNFKPAAVALVESTPPFSMVPYGSRPVMGKAVVESYERNRIVVRTNAAENTLLVLGEKYYSSWRAEVDGKRVDIQPTNHILRGIYLPAGEHKVVCEFYSSSFETGKYLTLGSLLFFAFLFGWKVWIRRKAKSEG
jgi:hypothetical protein